MKHKKSLLHWVPLMVFLHLLQPARSQQYIRVAGNHFEYQSGEKIVFRGVSIADPYKLKTDGHWQKDHLEKVKVWGANIVRFPVHPANWRATGEEKYLTLLDQGIQWAGELELYVIIDWHSIGNLHMELFQHEMYNTTQKETYEFWRTIAHRYKNNPTVAFYEIFNEPTTYHGQLGRVSWQDWKSIVENIITIIYAHDETVIPLVAGFDWAYDLTPLKEQPIDFPGIAYVSHPYPQKRAQPWETKWETDWGFAADRYPVMLTEIGFVPEGEKGAHIPVIGDESYGEAITGYCDKKGISWIVWCFDPDWSPMLINENYGPTRSGKFFKAAIKQDDGK